MPQKLRPAGSSGPIKRQRISPEPRQLLKLLPLPPLTFDLYQGDEQGRLRVTSHTHTEDITSLFSSLLLPIMPLSVAGGGPRRRAERSQMFCEERGGTDPRSESQRRAVNTAILPGGGRGASDYRGGGALVRMYRLV